MILRVHCIISFHHKLGFTNECTAQDEICTMYKDCAEQWFKASNTTEDGCTPNSLDDISELL